MNSSDTKNTSLEPSTFNLPEEPLVKIRSPKGWGNFNLIELWNYRDLLYVLTKRDIQIHYRQTALGAIWVIVQPLLTMLIFTFLFGRLTEVPSDGLPYPIFAYAGLIPWIFFSNALTNSGNSLVLNSSLITKVYFPRMIIPIAAAAAGLLDFLITFGFLILMMFYYKIGITVNILMLPILIAFISILAFGIGMYLSALNVKYRDVRYALPFLIQLGIFVTPIFYSTSLIPKELRWIFLLNPLAGLIEAFRSACFGLPFDWLSFGSSIILTIFIFLFTFYNFRKMEEKFSDLI